MTLEQLLEKQEGERKELAAAQVKAWQELHDRHERMSLSGNDHFPEYQAEKQNQLDKFNKEWGSEGTHAAALQKRHENERLKLSGAPPPKETSPKTDGEKLNQRTQKRRWRR